MQSLIGIYQIIDKMKTADLEYGLFSWKYCWKSKKKKMKKFKKLQFTEGGSEEENGHQFFFPLSCIAMHLAWLY